MKQDSEMLTAVRESFAGVHLNTPLDATIHRGRKLRVRRRMSGIAGATAIAGGAALTAAVLVPGGAARPTTSGTHLAQPRLAAWTVTRGPDNKVTILIRQLRDPAGMQRTLRADGVPTTVAFQAGVLSDTPPLPRGCHAPRLSDAANAQLQSRIIVPQQLGEGGPRGARIALTLRTAEIPKGIGLNLTVQSGASSWGWSLGLVQASTECTGS